MVENKIEPLLPSASPKTDSAPKFINLTDKPADFTELNWEILGKSTSDSSFENSLETAGPSQKQRREKEDKTKGNKRK